MTYSYFILVIFENISYIKNKNLIFYKNMWKFEEILYELGKIYNLITK